jgi:hypothetical protein
VSLDDQRFAVADILGSTNCDLRTVTRLIGKSTVWLCSVHPPPGAIAMRGGQADVDAVAAFGCHFELTLDDGETQRVVEELALRPDGSAGIDAGQ